MFAILGDVEAFLTRIFNELESLGVQVDGCELDHICYRVKTPEAYESKKIELQQEARVLSEVLINGRNIATFELNNPIVFRGRTIAVIELPFPKAGKITHEGLEHVEFVIQDSFELFIAKYPHLAFDISGSNKPHNPEIELCLGDVNVKFHHRSLKDHIRRES